MSGNNHSSTAAALTVTSLGALAEHGIDRTVIAIGVFDGVHLGHRRLLTTLLKMAERHDAVPAAFTFFPHPRALLFPDKAPTLLTTPEKKNDLLAAAGVRAIITVPFTREFASLEPEDFIRDTLISSRVRLNGICVGSSWRFGAQGRGNVENLRRFADRGHFDFEAVDELVLDGEAVSSTSIRRAIAAGRLEHAARLLGRPYSLIGKVVPGYHQAGDALRFPTANLEINCGVLPPYGVYAARVKYEGKEAAGAVNIGMSPTFNYSDLKHPRIEVHILDFHGNLYGQNIEVELLQYLREERGFPDTESLRRQIADDVSRIRALVTQKQ